MEEPMTSTTREKSDPKNSERPSEPIAIADLDTFSTKAMPPGHDGGTTGD